MIILRRDYISSPVALMNACRCLAKLWMLNDIKCGGQNSRKLLASYPRSLPDVTADEFIVMPNHAHGIMTITVRANDYLPVQEPPASYGLPGVKQQPRGDKISRFGLAYPKQWQILVDGVLYRQDRAGTG